MIRPCVPSPANRYARLFPPLDGETARKFSDEKLEFLSRSMRTPGDQTPIPFPLLITRRPPPAALTYFGQFIDHDLTCDSTPLREAGKCEPHCTVNERTPWLDLDHLYGAGPASAIHGHLYESDGASLRLGAPLHRGKTFDVPLDKNDRPEIADERNGENLIVRQIHAMFLKLHNLAVREVPATLPPAERFTRARQRVRWQYQWLVRSYYLRRLCDPAIYRAIVKEGDRRIDWEPDGFSIPVEFSVAAMRFGHSMVRNQYLLNGLTADKGGSGLVNLRDLFGRNNNGPLDPRFKVDWRRFSKSKEISMAIDTAIVEPLFQVPDETIHRFVDELSSTSTTRSLALRTLIRGVALRLPTGEQVRRYFGIESAISAAPPGYKEDPWAPLWAAGWVNETPLWYYVLLEAQLEQTGQRLGTVGSRLVAEVIEGALRMDGESFLRQKPAGWKPEEWKSEHGSIEIKTLLDVANLTGV